MKKGNITVMLMHTAPIPNVPSCALAKQDILGMVLAVQVTVLSGGVRRNGHSHLMLRRRGNSSECHFAAIADRAPVRYADISTGK